MAPNVQPIFIKTANNAEATWVPADTTTKKDLIVAGAEGSKVFSINVASNDTSVVEMEVYVHDGTTAFLLGTVDVASMSGVDGVTPSVNLLDAGLIPSLDADGELFLPSGYKIQCAPKATVTTGKTVTVIALGGDY